MKYQTFKDIYTDELAQGAYIHDAYIGFKEDYLILHCLLRIHNPKSVYEIGSNIGEGIKVMRAALPNAKIYSLDLDYETMKQNSKQYPIGADGEDRVGSAARHIDYTQLRGDSLTFDYKKYPCQAYFCDGEHDTLHAKQETILMLSCKPNIIIYHDSDMPEVMDGILQGLAIHTENSNYELYRVTDTRIAYLLRK